MKITKIVNILKAVLVIAFLTSCDFTPILHKKVLKAQALIQEQKHQDAIDQYLEILDKSPPKELKVKIYYQLAELYSTNIGDPINAIKYFELVKKTSDKILWVVKSQEKIADINFSYLKNYSESIINYTVLVEFVPKLQNLDFYEYRLAQSYLKNDQYDLAIKTITEIQKNTGHEHFIPTLYDLGMCYFRQNKLKNALVVWKEYIKREKIKSKTVQAKFMMANIYETLEQLKNAYDLYYSILSDYPNTDIIQNRLDAIYKRRVARKR